MISGRVRMTGVGVAERTPVLVFKAWERVEGAKGDFSESGR
jgi:hypothetical protein